MGPVRLGRGGSSGDTAGARWGQVCEDGSVQHMGLLESIAFTDRDRQGQARAGKNGQGRTGKDGRATTDGQRRAGNDGQGQKQGCQEQQAPHRGRTSTDTGGGHGPAAPEVLPRGRRDPQLHAGGGQLLRRPVRAQPADRPPGEGRGRPALQPHQPFRTADGRRGTPRTTGPPHPRRRRQRPGRPRRPVRTAARAAAPGPAADAGLLGRPGRGDGRLPRPPPRHRLPCDQRAQRGDGRGGARRGARHRRGGPRTAPSPGRAGPLRPGQRPARPRRARRPRAGRRR